MDHPYATRTRQNITSKYTSKLIDSVVLSHHYPPFPPPHVQLHPDDLNNKVFLAVARSFLTVDNRAMTIKDIAERACRYGLVCQNLSAAAQAITTYLRAHKARCDKQQDQPLLLSHTLSGTPADDDLVPALHSRSGGDSHPTENRLTNFRKGTAVWYLSRATGAPCPFSRAGIRLCDYVDPDAQDPVKVQSSSKKRLVERCGEKRKRPLRGCVARGSGSDNERPPKVKLTLRLKPLAVKPSTNEGFSSARSIDQEDDSDAYESSSDEDSMSVDYSDDESQTAQVNKDEEPWSLPPYPRRSISIPCYTPLQGYYPSYHSPSQYRDPYRRSPSIAYSIATPPPDSEDEVDDFHVTMSHVKDYTCHLSRNYDADISWDAEPDSEGDGETMWESPGPRSPSAPIMQSSEVTIKEEPRDVQGMLDAWDDFDSTIADARVAEVIAKAVFDMEGKERVKLEAIDPWDWDSSIRVNLDWPSEETAHIKQEDFGVDFLFPLSVPGPSSPLSPVPPHSSQFSPFSSSPNNLNLEALTSDEHSEQKYAAVRPRAKTVPVPSAFFQAVAPTSASSFSLSPPLPRQPRSAAPSNVSSRDSSVPSTTLVKLLQSMSVITTPSNSVLSSSYAISPPTPCISPLQTRCQPFPTAPKIVVHTCQPCNPAISATQIEDISVYQMMLGAFQLLRRIDTDFVNLSPIVAYSGSPHPVHSIIANATIVTKGSPEVSGTWVPLPAAQVYVKEHLAGDLALDIFLSDALVERFPSALQDFYRSNASARSLNQFGKPFESTLQAAKLEVQTDNGTPVCWDSRFGRMHDESSSGPASASAPFALTVALAMGGKQAEDMEVPLSATEQEIFQELCMIPDWDKESSEGREDAMVLDSCPSEPAPVEEEENVQTTTLPPVFIPVASVPTCLSHTEHPDRPLRRSKRVADALAAAHQAPPQPSRTRSRKAGSRNSLS